MRVCGRRCGSSCAERSEEDFGFEIEHQEGDFPSLTIEIVNPREGLLSEDRDRWAWLSWKKPDDTVVPLFHGRLIGVPETIGKDVVKLEFSARPADYEAQKAALAETLKVLPYYDPVWVDPDKLSDPDTVLEARPELWHIGRTDKLVTTSNILVGEDGSIALSQDDLFADTLEMSYGETPIGKMHVEATVEWNQIATGHVDLSQKIIDAFDSAFNISSYTGQGLEADWPTFGVDMGGGWSVYQSFVELLSGTASKATYVSSPIDPARATPDFEIEPWWEDSPQGFDYWYQKAYDEWLAQQMLNPIREARFYLWVFKPTFVVQYDADRERKEVLSFDVSADTQPLLFDQDPTVETLTLQSSAVSSPIDPDGKLPIGDIGRNTFFGLDRGKDSIGYLLMLVRAKMLYSARAVQVSFETSFATGVNFSCRKSIVLTSADLPGGECEGKITAYTLVLDNGELSATVTIGCSIGMGNTLDDPSVGIESYVDPDYVSDYQYYAGADIDPIAGVLSFKDFEIVPKDDGIDFGNMTPDNVVGDVKATALLTMTGPGDADDTITVNGHVYTLVEALTDADQVLIGIDQDETARNLADAINATEGKAGITYGTGTVANADASATVSDGIVRVTAFIAGPSGNDLTVAEDCADASWDATKFHEGSHGVRVFNPPATQRTELNQVHGSVKEAIDALNALYTEIAVALKPVEGGPFETDVTIEVSDLMVPKTIDLEAA